MKAIFPILVLLLFATIPAQAEQFGLFTYEVTDGEITITDYPQDATGHVEIPAEIDGLPVTVLAERAFSQCHQITSAFVPAGVRSLIRQPFTECSNLSALNIAPGNAFYRSIDGIVFDQSGTELIFVPKGISGHYTVPNGIVRIRGNKATGMFFEYAAFENCTKLTSITIPGSVESIGPEAFLGCRRLGEIEVAQGSTTYKSFEGVLYSADLTTLLLCPEGKQGSLIVPLGVTSIFGTCFSGCFAGAGGKRGAFDNCRALEHITLPASLQEFGRPSFQNCSSLRSALFLGDPPLGTPTTRRVDFPDAAPDFTIYYLSSSTGFTSPTWRGYPTVMLDETTYPAAPWLVSHGLPQDTDLNQDLNNDGVDLLMAYALDLDPNTNLQSMMPTPVINDSSLTLSFHATAPGITYTVETSTDLKNWTTDGVTISDLDANKHRTASIPLDSTRRYMLLVVAESP